MINIYIIILINIKFINISNTFNIFNIMYPKQRIATRPITSNPVLSKFYNK